MAFSAEQFTLITTLARSYGATRLFIFGSALDSPDTARDLDLACDGIPGWKLYELAARLEQELNVPLDLVPLTPPTRFTQLIERRGRRLLLRKCPCNFVSEAEDTTALPKFNCLNYDFQDYWIGRIQQSCKSGKS